MMAKNTARGYPNWSFFPQSPGSLHDCQGEVYLHCSLHENTLQTRLAHVSKSQARNPGTEKPDEVYVSQHVNGT